MISRFFSEAEQVIKNKKGREGQPASVSTQMGLFLKPISFPFTRALRVGPVRHCRAHPSLRFGDASIRT